ncbi:thioredoxin family protein [Qaidamihabitans albus]|uniref:thioredoxin family protein n=1 Tax=Qaidamihabitans albus TaxID=2795733 RepID=UPI0018F268C1|nr:thioredoxin family protein [Qaidamihabitans albus]
MTGLWVLVATLVAGLVAGGVLAARNGRIRGSGRAGQTPRTLPGPVVEALDPAASVTLVQLSTTFCAPCRQARTVLAGLAERTEGLHHVELDVTNRPQVAQELGVLRTPTTLALGRAGEELLRVSGVPRSGELLAALEPHLG